MLATNEMKMMVVVTQVPVAIPMTLTAAVIQMPVMVRITEVTWTAVMWFVADKTNTNSISVVMETIWRISMGKLQSANLKMEISSRVSRFDSILHSEN